MKRYSLELKLKAKEDIKKYIKAGDKVALKKLKTLFKEIKDHPRTGTGKPEQLKGHDKHEVWSRRITDKHRLIYEIQENVVIVLVLSAFGHYDDK